MKTQPSSLNPAVAAFDPESFRELGHRLIDRLAGYLARSTGGADDLPVLPWATPERMAEAWPSNFPEGPGADALELLGRYVAQSIHIHHPRFAGHQVGPALPLAALADLVASLVNNSNAIHEMSPAGTAMERSVIRWMADALGFPPEAGGVLTSGGSLANLTALLAARQAKAGDDAWTEGNGGGPPMAVMASAEAHYSVDRAARIMGWGQEGVILVPVDADYRLDPTALEDGYQAATRAGRRVIALVANAGSTATGAFDPLEAMADFAAAHNLWLHVDGAHGAPVVLSGKYRHLVRGIERADSVAWDAHKMMLMPSLASAALFRQEAHSAQAFAQEASYLLAGGASEEWYNLGHRTLECTKRVMSLKLYVALAVVGTRFFADYVTTQIDLARRFGQMIAESPDFELATRPQGNIICFRYAPWGIADPNELQARVRRRIIESGRFFIVQAWLRGSLYLRSTLLNPFATERDLAALLDEIRRLAVS